MKNPKTVVVRPKVIDDLLINPGMGFMTFQRFNGDTLNEGKKWTEGYPINYQNFDGSLENKDHPMTSIAYFRIYWKFLEPEKGKYRWDMIDQALKTAKSRNQTLMFRVAPYGSDMKSDVPDWYREMIGKVEENLPVDGWRTDPEDPRYAECFGGFIRALGERYDGHPDMESVDLSIVGAWGEGCQSQRLTQKTREALVDAYVESFSETPLIMLLTDEKTNKYGLSKADVGWRVDCLGDMGGFNESWIENLGGTKGDWSHMLDWYPQQIIKNGMRDAWKKAPVSLEVCWVIQHWKDMGWDINYIIDQSLKWHISSFNSKSSPVPEEWEPNVERWLKKMGYRLALRKFAYPSIVRTGDKLEFTSWWENLGVAPCYRDFPLALRLKNGKVSKVIKTGADIREWLPGDSLYDNSVVVPADMPVGKYELQVGILDKFSDEPKIKLAVNGKQPDGWYSLQAIEVT